MSGLFCHIQTQEVRCIFESVHVFLLAALHQAEATRFLSQKLAADSPSKTAGSCGAYSVFKMQTRPVNFPLITVRSSLSKAEHCIFPFIFPAPLRQTGVDFERGDEGCSQRRGRRGGDSLAESLIFAPGVCASAAVALSLSED